jgi:hypothetical protein
MEQQARAQSEQMQKFMHRMETHCAESDVRVETLVGSVEKAISRIDAAEGRLNSRIDALEKRLEEPNEEVTRRLKALEDRVAAVESKPPPPLSAGFVAGLAGGPSLPTSAGASSASSAHRLGSAAWGGSVQAGKFVPTKLMVRGWSVYGDREAGRNGLSKDEATRIAEALLGDMDKDLRAMIKLDGLFHRNWQLVLRFVDGVEGEDCWNVLREVKSKLLGVRVNDRDLYATMEQPPWKALANRHLRAAAQAMRETVQSSMEFAFEWKQPQLYLTKLDGKQMDVLLGSEHRKECRWQWNSVALDKLGIAVPQLARAFEAAL